MSTSTIAAAAAALGLTLLSGAGDAYGFVHAARVWEAGQWTGAEAVRSAVGFVVGIGCYWLAIRFLTQLGVHSAALLAIAWFGVTIVGIALSTGEFSGWSRPSQAVAVLVVVGIGWLLATNDATGGGVG